MASRISRMGCVPYRAVAWLTTLNLPIGNKSPPTVRPGSARCCAVLARAPGAVRARSRRRREVAPGGPLPRRALAWRRSALRAGDEEEDEMAGSVIVAGARTPIGRLQGGLASFTATQLGGFAVQAALDRAGVSPSQVDYVYMGQVLQAGVGQIGARQAATYAGIPMSVPATTVNKVCLSGLNTIILADQLIAAGEADIVVAGGMESMTNAPYLLPGARDGFRLGDKTVVDSLMFDGLTCAFDHCAMGASTGGDAAAAGLARAAMDEVAARSHERAATAQKDGLFDAEVVAVSVPQRRGEPVVVDRDEGIRPGTTADSLAGLAGVFGGAGNVTAGNASQISDGACAVVVMSAAKARELVVQPLGEVLAYGQIAGGAPGEASTSLLTQPSRAIRKAL